MLKTNMNPKVQWNGKFKTVDIDWQKLVLEPMNQDYYVQAFASADAILDEVAESMLRDIFNGYESQTLINHLHSIRGTINFNGLAYFQILKDRGVIDNNLINKVKDFKGARNKVAHSVEGEYNLIDNSETQNLHDQESYDKASQQNARNYLHKAFEIFETLHEIDHARNNSEES